jgi:hypothetical protein
MVFFNIMILSQNFKNTLFPKVPCIHSTLRLTVTYLSFSVNREDIACSSKRIVRVA